MDAEQYPSIWERAAALGVDVAILLYAAGCLFTIAIYAGADITLPGWWVMPLAGSVALAALWRWWLSPGCAAISIVLVDARTGQRPGLLLCALRSLFILPVSVAATVFVTMVFILGAPHVLEGVGPRYFTTMGLFGLGFAVGLLPYAVCALNPRRRSLWDYLTGTVVIRKSRPATRSAPDTPRRTSGTVPH